MIDFLPEIWRLDPDSLSGSWRYGGSIIAGIIAVFSILSLRPLVAALMDREMRETAAMVIVVFGFVVVAAGIAAFDVGWVVIGVVMLVAAGEVSVGPNEEP